MANEITVNLSDAGLKEGSEIVVYAYSDDQITASGSVTYSSLTNTGFQGTFRGICYTQSLKTIVKIYDKDKQLLGTIPYTDTKELILSNIQSPIYIKASGSGAVLEEIYQSSNIKEVTTDWADGYNKKYTFDGNFRLTFEFAILD